MEEFNFRLFTDFQVLQLSFFTVRHIDWILDLWTTKRNDKFGKRRKRNRERK